MKFTESAKLQHKWDRLIKKAKAEKSKPVFNEKLGRVIWGTKRD